MKGLSNDLQKDPTCVSSRLHVSDSECGDEIVKHFLILVPNQVNQDEPEDCLLVDVSKYLSMYES